MATPLAPSRPAGKTGLTLAAPPPELNLSNFKVEGSVSTATPASGDVTGGMKDWGMLGNGPDPHNLPFFPNGAGDCGAAATEHYRMAQAIYGMKDGKPVFESTFRRPHTHYTQELYLEYGHLLEPNIKYPDFGVTNLRWLQMLYQKKIIEGFAAVPMNMLYQAMLEFRGVITGVALPPNAMQEFEMGRKWTIGVNNQPDPNEGHDILLVAFNETEDTYVTWGQLQLASKPWTQKCIIPDADVLNSITLPDAWVIMTKELANRSGYDLAKAQATIESMPGFDNLLGA